MLRNIFLLVVCVAPLGLVLGSHRPHFKNENVDVFNTIQPRSENRLLNNTLPLHYNVELTTNIHDQQTTFSGEVEIRFRTLESLTRIRLNSYLLTINECQLFTTNYQSVPVTNCVTVDRFLDVTAGSLLNGNTEYYLRVNFVGTHRAPSEGFHYSYYTTPQNTRRYLASTQFQSVFAREAFPCFDEPYYRVPIKLTIRHDPSFRALANAEIETSIAGVTVFKETWGMPSYLIAFVVSDFECTEKKGKQRICAQPNRMDETGLAVESSDLILNWMEKTFATTYEEEKLDHIAIPTFQFGGMENWGLVVYHPSYLLFKEGVDTVNDKINVASVVAHELAHMFYGNLITPKWWSYLWLSEGLATLYEFYGAHAAYPELRLDELFVVWTLQSVLRVDASGNSRPMTYYVDTVDGIEGIFDSIAYSKAGSIFRMIKYAIGESTFHKAMQKYLATNKHSGVDEKPMYEALEAAIAEDRTAPVGAISRIMDTWSLQGGYPVLSVERSYTTGQIHIRQSEFIARSGVAETNKLWGIPITFTQRTGRNFEKDHANFWLEAREQDVANDVPLNDWVIFNVLQSGYYRVNYDSHNWKLLISELLSGDLTNFPPTNRAQLVDDINVLADYGLVENVNRLALMEYLSEETDMVPLIAARRHLIAMNKMMIRSSKYESFQRFVRKIVEKSFKAVDKFSTVEDDVNTFQSRSVLIDLACLAGMEECLGMTRTLLFSELKTEMAMIDKEDREMVYCHGLRSVSQKEFSVFMDKFEELYRKQSSEDSNEDFITNDLAFDSVERMANVMGCFADKDGVQDLLKSLFSEEFTYLEFRYPILKSIIANGNIELVLDYLVENVRDLTINETEKEFWASILLDLSSEIYSETDSAKLTSILRIVSDGGYDVSPVIAENLENNKNWYNQHGNEFESFLALRYPDDCEFPIAGSGFSITGSMSVLAVALIAKLLL